MTLEEMRKLLSEDVYFSKLEEEDVETMSTILMTIFLSFLRGGVYPLTKDRITKTYDNTFNSPERLYYHIVHSGREQDDDQEGRMLIHLSNGHESVLSLYDRYVRDNRFVLVSNPLYHDILDHIGKNIVFSTPCKIQGLGVLESLKKFISTVSPARSLPGDILPVPEKDQIPDKFYDLGNGTQVLITGKAGLVKFTQEILENEFKEEDHSTPHTKVTPEYVESLPPGIIRDAGTQVLHQKIASEKLQKEYEKHLKKIKLFKDGYHSYGIMTSIIEYYHPLSRFITINKY